MLQKCCNNFVKPSYILVLLGVNVCSNKFVTNDIKNRQSLE